MGQNFSYDMQVLFREYGAKSSSVDDTMIAQNCLFPQYSKGLDMLTRLYTDYPYYKDEGKGYLPGKDGCVLPLDRIQSRISGRERV